MKIKRYIAADMRSALAAVREEQGLDAVILGTRAVPQGVEVCAAVDLELAAAPGSLAETAALKQLEQDALAALTVEPAAAAGGPAPSPIAQALSTPISPSADTLPSVAAAAAAQRTLEIAGARMASGAASTDVSIGEQLRSLRELLEQQLAALTWNDFTRRAPLKARALSELARLGLAAPLSLSIIEELPAELAEEQQQRMTYALLARRIATCAPPMQRSGALLLVGPPGAGKTTLLSKLAARYVLEQDAANLLILSTDDERLGSHEQLACLGRLLGVRVERIVDAEALIERVTALPDRCILIDTPGLCPRDSTAAAAYRALLERCPTLTAMLVLPASAQAGVVEDAVTHFGPGLASCCTVTRLDEAVSLGGVLSALTASGLPVAQVCEGPRIPEDLKPARAHQLVARAVELARIAQHRVDDDLLSRRYGASAPVRGASLNAAA